MYFSVFRRKGLIMVFLSMEEVATKLPIGNISNCCYSSWILARTDDSLLYEISSEEMVIPVWGNSSQE